LESEDKIPPSQKPALIKSRLEVKQLEESLRKQSNKIEKLEKDNERLKKENEKLKQELSQIRQPPKWAKANKSEDAKRAAKNPGAKKGHECHPRKTPDHVDREVKLIASTCPDCNHDLPGPHKWHKHIQIDIPPPSKVIVTRYHVGWSWCRSCGKEVSSKEKLSGSLYGPNLHGQVCYWKFCLGLTFNKIEKLLSEQYHLEVSRGQLSALIKRSAESFNGAYEDLKTSLLDQPYIHADETGWRNAGDSHWLWSFSNKEISYYHMDKSRGQKVVQEVLGKVYRGVLISDFYGGYHKIDCQKQKCWVHLLREVRELKKKFPKEAGFIFYSKALKRFFNRGIALAQNHQAGRDVDKKLKRLEDDIMRFAHQKQQHSDLVRLSKRIIKYRRELYVFVKTGVDATNNHAEREIRPAVLMRKTSYGNRSQQGGKNQAVLMSMIRTARKKNQDFLKLASQALINH
jgi:hypothetical protein